MTDAGKNTPTKQGDKTARGFDFNADLVSVIRFLDIGTRAVQSVR